MLRTKSNGGFTNFRFPLVQISSGSFERRRLSECDRAENPAATPAFFFPRLRIPIFGHASGNHGSQKWKLLARRGVLHPRSFEQNLEPSLARRREFFPICKFNGTELNFPRVHRLPSFPNASPVGQIWLSPLSNRPISEYPFRPTIHIRFRTPLDCLRLIFETRNLPFSQRMTTVF